MENKPTIPTQLVKRWEQEAIVRYPSNDWKYSATVAHKMREAYVEGRKQTYLSTLSDSTGDWEKHLRKWYSTYRDRAPGVDELIEQIKHYASPPQPVQKGSPVWVKASGFSEALPHKWHLIRRIGVDEAFPAKVAKYVIADVAGKTYERTEIEVLVLDESPQQSAIAKSGLPAEGVNMEVLVECLCKFYWWWNSAKGTNTMQGAKQWVDEVREAKQLIGQLLNQSASVSEDKIDAKEGEPLEPGESRCRSCKKLIDEDYQRWGICFDCYEES